MLRWSSTTRTFPVLTNPFLAREPRPSPSRALVIFAWADLTIAAGTKMSGSGSRIFRGVALERPRLIQTAVGPTPEVRTS